MNAKESICIPLTDTENIKAKLYDKEIKEACGLHNIEKQNRAKNILKQIPRELENLGIYNPIVEYVDLQPFFGTNLKALHQYLSLTKLISLLHQKKQDIKITETEKTIETKGEYMLEALRLYKGLWLKKEEELYFNVRHTFTTIKNYLKGKDKTETFKLQDIRKQTGKSPVTVQRHLKTLEDYGKIERTGGNHKQGFSYTVTDWQENRATVTNYEELLKNLEQS
jgi:DNA-binding MarR family transcriptional regulator